MDIHKAYYNSPIGKIEITGNDEGIISVFFIEENIDKSPSLLASDNFNKKESSKVITDCIQQLDEYFASTRRQFELKLNPEGTAFQKKVWSKLIKIPYGKTKSYLDIAKQIGDANANRAVGNANAKNPVSIIVPCHRVIGNTGELVGYSGGMWRKEWLLNHENSAVFGKQIELF